MLLNKHRPVRTLKSKLAWLYVALFMVTQLLCMAVIYFCQQHSVYSDARKKAAIFSDEFTYEYMTGAEFSYATERFSPDRIDDSILSAVNQIMPGFMAETAYVDPLGDTTVLGVASGKVYAFTSSRTNATAISRVEWWLDGKKVQETGVFPYSCVWQAVSGRHELLLKAWDTAGNVTSSAKVTFTVTK